MKNRKLIIKYDENNVKFREILVKLIKNEEISKEQYGILYSDNLIHDDIENGLKFKEYNGERSVEFIAEGLKFEKTIHLYPSLHGDSRWNTVGIPASSLFLNSTLVEYGFRTASQRIELPSDCDKNFEDIDIIGMTVFEDLLVQIKKYIKKTDFINKILCFGGPALTLNPLETIYFLEEGNIFVRGEAEFVFPEILKCLKTGDLDRLMELNGFVLNFPGLLIISDIEFRNCPEFESGFKFRIDEFSADQFVNGVELNLSRGCKRSCIFCSKVQGRKIRKLNSESFREFLKQIDEKISSDGDKKLYGRTLNLNDDDIFQDFEYAREIFEIIKEEKFRLWGIQTSVNSFFDKNGKIDHRFIDLISDSDLFVDGKRLLWLGTDGFLRIREKKLGKKIPGKIEISDLVREFQMNNVENYHYWISSDHRSDFSEFIDELEFIYDLRKISENFHIIAHAPFLVPYSSTPLYKYLNKDPEMKKQIVIDKILNEEVMDLRFYLVKRVLTMDDSLNNFLIGNSEKTNDSFFDYINKNNFFDGFLTIYNFLKECRLKNPEFDRNLENRIEGILSEIV